MPNRNKTDKHYLIVRLLDGVAWVFGWIEGMCVGCLMNCSEVNYDLGLADGMMNGCYEGYSEAEWLNHHK
jgi:hypothetical protein